MSRSRELKKTSDKKPQTRNKEKKAPRPASGLFVCFTFVCLFVYLVCLFVLCSYVCFLSVCLFYVCLCGRV